MDFRFTDAQTLLVNTARDFLRHRCPPAVLEDSVASERGFSTELWKEISLLGWPGLLIPLEYGGSGGSLLDVSLLIEEMGRACFPSPYVQSAVVATSLLVTAANPAQRERQLPALARGDRICTLALTEDSASFERDGLGLEGDVGGKLTGRKLFVKDAHVADDLIVVTRGVAGPNLFLLETQRAGVVVALMETIAGEKPCEVSLAGVETRADDLLGTAGQGWELLRPPLPAGGPPGAPREGRRAPPHPPARVAAPQGAQQIRPPPRAVPGRPAFFGRLPR